jgi:hypothetical protein
MRQRVDGGAVHTNLEMKMRTGRIARLPDPSEDGASGHALPKPHPDPREMRVQRPEAAVVSDRDEQSPAVPSSRPHDPAGGGCLDRSAGAGEQVDACVEPVAARAESVAYRREQRTSKHERRVARRHVELRVRPRAGRAARRQSTQQLKAAERACDLRAEATVESPRRKAIPGKRELKRNDIRASFSPPQEAVAERVPCERAERPPRLRANNTVHGQMRPSLETTNGALGRTIESPVDDAAVQVVAVQRHLQTGYGRIAVREGDRCCDKSAEDHDACSRSTVTPHHHPDFGARQPFPYRIRLPK